MENCLTHMYVCMLLYVGTKKNHFNDRIFFLTKLEGRRYCCCGCRGVVRLISIMTFTRIEHKPLSLFTHDFICDFKCFSFPFCFCLKLPMKSKYFCRITNVLFARYLRYFLLIFKFDLTFI